MAKKEKIIVNNKVILNETKYRRANDIVNLINSVPTTQHIRSEYSIEGQLELKAKFANLLKEEGIDAKKNTEEAVLFVYRALSGAIRTMQEEVAETTKTRKTKKVVVDDDDDSPGADDEGEDN